MTAIPEHGYPRQVKVRANFETLAWRWMRYSALLLIPLVWFHVLLQDVIVGVHRIDLDYVALLAFAFAHGMNGLRQVLNDYIHAERGRRIIAWLLLLAWLTITAIGGIAIVVGARPA